MAHSLVRLVMAPLLVAGCLSEDRAREKWSDFVNEHNSCSVAEDCALVYPGCPLGCVSAVNVQYVAKARRKARRLTRRYELPGRTCDNDCLGASGATCDGSRCAVEPDQY